MNFSNFLFVFFILVDNLMDSHYDNWRNDHLQDLLHQHVHLMFNIRNVPQDLKLVHSALRVYLKPRLPENRQATVSIYELKLPKNKRHIRRNKNQLTLKPYKLTLVDSVNISSNYYGWLEFNTTVVLKRWLKHHHFNQHHRAQLLIGVDLLKSDESEISINESIFPGEFGLIPPQKHSAEKEQKDEADLDVESLQPFMIGYFQGPHLHTKIQKLRRKKRGLEENSSGTETGTGLKTEDLTSKLFPILSISEASKVYRATVAAPACNRHNFTLDFKDIYHSDWVISPKQFQAYYCGGECIFPLSARMNATNHAIVQTLMHLKMPNLPKPCCVPTSLGSISILHYINEDSVNLTKYPQSVAKACGCL